MDKYIVNDIQKQIYFQKTTTRISEGRIQQAKEQSK